MNKQLPSIFKNSSDKRINNNKRVFYSKYESIGNVVERENDIHDSNINDLNSPNSFTNSIDNLFKNKHSEIPNELKENTQLIAIQQYPWYKRLYQKILAIFGIRNK